MERRQASRRHVTWGHNVVFAFEEFFYLALVQQMIVSYVNFDVKNLQFQVTMATALTNKLAADDVVKNVIWMISARRLAAAWMDIT